MITIIIIIKLCLYKMVEWNRIGVEEHGDKERAGLFNPEHHSSN